MKKASRMLLLLGLIFTSFSLVLFVMMTVVSFMIAAPNYKEELIKQLTSGSLHTTFPGTPAEQAAQIQNMFLIMAIVFLLITIISVGKLVFANLSRRNEEKKFYIVSLVLSSLTLDVFIILASIFGLLTLNEEEEVINASI